jgi:hypothetical protein
MLVLVVLASVVLTLAYFNLDLFHSLVVLEEQVHSLELTQQQQFLMTHMPILQLI